MKSKVTIHVALAIAAASCNGDATSRSPDGEFAIAAVTPAAAQRFLEQATFGPRLAPEGLPPPADSVEHVLEVGIHAALTEQLDTPAELFEATPPRVGNCAGPFPPEFDLGSQLFVDALASADQLRLRTAFALSQILVANVNGVKENDATCTSEKRDAILRYYNALRSGAFGSYRELLEEITLEPVMGTFLDMVDNVGMGKTGPITANENFARELLQLFTIGLYQLNDRGERVLVGGEPQPAYTEDDVKAFARTLTGWTFASPTGCPDKVGGKNAARYDGPMIPCQLNHNPASAQLLAYRGAPNGGVTTDQASAKKHLQEALDNVFYHPNLPPFVSMQLIQHLVTSNPSPQYVARVVAKFKDDGTASHRRGNLRAVVRAILLDPEAREPAALGAYGRLRAPAELLPRMLRGLGAKLDLALDPGTFLNGKSGELGQSVSRPPSVFSYYPPDHPLPGSTSLVGPEFALLDTATQAGRAELLQTLLHGGRFVGRGVDIADGLAAMPGDPAEIVDWIDQQFLHGAMSTGPAGLRTLLSEALADSRSGTTDNKKRLALFLTFLSPEFEIQR